MSDINPLNVVDAPLFFKCFHIARVDADCSIECCSRHARIEAVLRDVTRFDV